MQTAVKKPPQKSLREKVESTEDISRAEMVWYGRFHGSDLVWNAIHRCERNTTPGRVPTDIRRDVHTHTFADEEKDGALPSPTDYKHWVQMIPKTSVQAFIVLSINSIGKMIGAAFFMPTKKLRDDRAQNNVLFDVDLSRNLEVRYNIGRIGAGDMRELSDKKEMLQFVVSEGFFKVRFKPMPDYRFDMENGIFVKID